MSQKNRQSTTCGQTHTHTHTHKEKGTSRVLPHLTCPQGIIGERTVVGGVVEQKEGLHPWVHLLKPRDSLLLQLLQDVRGSPVPIVVLAGLNQRAHWLTLIHESAVARADEVAHSGAVHAVGGGGRKRSTVVVVVAVVGVGPTRAGRLPGGGRSWWWGARAEAR